MQFLNQEQIEQVSGGLAIAKPVHVITIPGLPLPLPTPPYHGGPVYPLPY